MKRLLTSIVFACGLTATASALAQGGYTVMTANPPPQAPVVVASPSSTPAPPPTLSTGAPAPTGPVEQITPSHGPAPRGVAAPVEARRPEEYGGITPGMPSVPPGLRRARRAQGGPTRVAWPGFQMVPGGSRLFVVLTAPQPVGEATRNGRTRVFHIPSASILLSNNRRPLITEAFATPVSRAFLRPGRGGVDLVVELRAEVEPTISQGTSTQGFHFVYLNFPSFAAPELARIQLPVAAVVSVPEPRAQAAPVAPVVPPPQVQIGAPQERPGSDAERPPGVH